MKFTPIAALLALTASAVAAQPPPEALPRILHLQLDQRAAWRTYKDVLAQTRAEGSHTAAEAARMNGLTTPERLDALRSQLKVQAADFERQAQATEDFYAVLSPDQRRIFDEVTRLPSPPSPMHAYARRDDPSLQPSGGAPGLRTPPAGAPLPPPTP